MVESSCGITITLKQSVGVQGQTTKRTRDMIAHEQFTSCFLVLFPTNKQRRGELNIGKFLILRRENCLHVILLLL